MTVAEWIAYCLLVVLVIGFFVSFLIALVKDEKYRKQQAEKEAKAPKDPFPEPSEECFIATVIDLTCRVGTVGTKTPRMVKEFTVILRDEVDEIYRFSVSEDYYEGLEVGQRGNVTLKNGAFYSFELEP